MIKEFKEFIAKGNVMALAIGIIIGLAFGKIVTSLVNDIVMPPIGLLLGNVDFANLFINLSGKGEYATVAAAKAAGAATLNYGVFINTIIEFLIIAAVIFVIVQQMKKMEAKPQAGPPTTKECPYCTSTISIKAVRCPYCTSELK